MLLVWSLYKIEEAVYSFSGKESTFPKIQIQKGDEGRRGLNLAFPSFLKPGIPFWGLKNIQIFDTVVPLPGTNPVAS